MTTHSISPHRATLHGTFSPEWPAVLTIEPGDTVVFETLDARWTIGDPGGEIRNSPRFAPKDPERDNGHALCGPIAIEGAEPGMVLVVEIGELVPGTFGWTFGGGWLNSINERLGLQDDEVVLNWRIDRSAGTATDQFGRTVALKPFFGVMGMPGTSSTPVPSWTPRPQGGNIDCQELGTGTTLFLPIAVEGALFSAGDGHARQGDGEVAATAIECPIESAALTFSLRSDLALTTPVAWTPDAWITFGFDEDLDEAVIVALDAMLDLMGREHGLPRNQGLALAGIVADLRITQIVNGVRGVHMMLRHDAIDGL